MNSSKPAGEWNTWECLGILVYWSMMAFVTAAGLGCFLGHVAGG